jgi:hypothetical protein
MEKIRLMQQVWLHSLIPIESQEKQGKKKVWSPTSDKKEEEPNVIW